MVFSMELDLLEIQLNELADVVDYFLIAESEVTFRGKPKPMFMRENKERFRAFWKKIVPVTILPRADKDFSGFEMEFWTRKTFIQAFDTMVNMEGERVSPIQEFDWLALVDADEILRKSVLQVVRACETPVVMQVRS